MIRPIASALPAADPSTAADETPSAAAVFYPIAASQRASERLKAVVKAAMTGNGGTAQ